jgi:hypothetical protein
LQYLRAVVLPRPRTGAPASRNSQLVRPETKLVATGQRKTLAFTPAAAI